jgi:hypothetical protein
MKNLKKVLALVLSMALLISTFTVSFAAEATKNLEQATKLNTMGLFNGVSTTEFKPALEDATNRIQAFVIIGRELNWDLTEIKATNTDEYYFTDVEGEEAIKMAQYAWEQGYTKGIGNNKFGSKNPVTSRELYTWFYNALGFNKDGDAYADPMLLVKAGLASTEEAGAIVKDSYTTKKALLRDDLVGVMYAALNWKAKDSETDLVTDLVAAKKVTEEAAVAAGVYTKVVEELTVADVEALNLVQIKVEFTTNVDKDSAEEETYYNIKKGSNKQTVANATLLEDGKTVILTLAKGLDQQDKVSVTVKGVEDVNEDKMDEVTVKDIEFLDTTIPEAISAEVVGNDTIKVTFSEPLKFNGSGGELIATPATDTILDKKAFSVNGGKLYIKEVRLQKCNTEAMVELYSDLKDGETTIEINGKAKDFADFGVLKSSFTVNVVEDKDAPEVVGYEKATPNGVTLIFNEDIEIKDASKKNFYHTNSKNQIDNDVVESTDVNGNKLKLKFTTDNPLPTGGVAYVYVAEKAINDLWDNVNTQQMIKIDVEVDVTAPEVDGEVDVKAEDKVVVYFTEDLNKKSAEDEDNYKLLDADGKEVKNIIDDVEYTASTSKKAAYVTIEFGKKLSGQHALVIEDVKDVSSNVIDDTTLAFDATDKTKPEDSKWTAKIYKAGVEGQMVRVTFGEVMASEGKYSVLDLEKYEINNVSLADLKVEATITLVEGGKAVEIAIPAKTDDEKNGVDFNDSHSVTIARVADAAGNYTANQSNSVALDPAGNVIMKSVVATATDKVVVTFDSEFAEFDDDDIVLTTSKASKNDAVNNKLTIAEVDNDLNDDGNTVITFTLDKNYKLDYTGKRSGDVYAYVVASTSHNDLDETIANGSDWAKQTVKDKIAPVLAKDVDHDDDNDTDKVVNVTVNNSVHRTTAGAAANKDDADGTVILTFTEDINEDTLSLLTFVVEDFNVEEAKVTNNNEVTLYVIDRDSKTAPGTGHIKHGIEVTQKYPIKDTNGNAVEGIEEEVYEPVKEIKAANDAIKTVADNADDVSTERGLVTAATNKGASAGDDNKYDIDTTKLTTVETLVTERAKYTNSSIANNVAVDTDVTSTIINASSPDSAITVEYVIKTDVGSYLELKDGVIKLVKDNDTGGPITAVVTITLKLNDQTVTKDLNVVIVAN